MGWFQMTLVRLFRVALGGVALVLVAPCAFALVAPGSAAEAAVSGNYTSTARVIFFSTGHGLPRPSKLPSRVVQVGFVETEPFSTPSLINRGTEVNRVTITGHPSPNTYRFNGTGVDYYDTGAVLSSWHGTYKIRRDGRIDESTRGRITGGTGTYEGITGTVVLTGKYRDKGRGTIITYHIHGTWVQ